MGSENAHGCAHKAENGLGFDFLERYHKDGDECLNHCWSISTRSCLTNLLTALISLRATTTCLPTWRTGWDHSPSTIMRSWERVKTWLNSQAAYKNLLLDKTRTSIPAVTTLNSGLCMYVFLVDNNFFSLLVLLTAHRRLLSEQPSYIFVFKFLNGDGKTKVSAVNHSNYMGVIKEVERKEKILQD
jgi:hypothetical protein